MSECAAAAAILAVAVSTASGAGSDGEDDVRAAGAPPGEVTATLTAIEPALTMADLGRRLFFDTILSEDGTLSCASCHLPSRAFSGDVAIAEGIAGRRGRRNAPSILNRAGAKAHFWDGRASTLEEQALLPIENEDEFGSTIEAALKRLRASEAYQRDFVAAFDDGVTADNLAAAIAAFERTLVADESPVDRFMQAEFTAISDAARKGKWIFESSGGCWKCHSGRHFSDELFHNTGVGIGGDDLGRFEVTGDEADRGAFKTPALRNVALTAPYMHDGSMATLREVVEFYNRGGEANDDLDPLMEPLELSEEEIDFLIAFLEALTSENLEHLPGVVEKGAQGGPDLHDSH